MIAAAREVHETLRPRLLGADGKPLPVNRLKNLADFPALPLKKVSARYDAAQDTDTHRVYWGNADLLDADSANSPDVRRKLVSRSRLAARNNPFYAGMIQTHANYLIGTGPKLRMQTGNERFNVIVETIWNQWAKAVKLQRLLWCLAHAKVLDGEGLAVAGTNPALRTRVKLDLRLVETEQCCSPYLSPNEPGYVDGIKFDEFGNPLWFDILPYHPGGSEYTGGYQDPEQVPARYVLHWFTMLRPGQHRGVPEFSSSLNTGAASHRFREATLQAAESAANPALLLKTDQAPEDAELPEPFTTAQLYKGLMMALPFQYSMEQVKAEHPNAMFEAFLRAQISEQGRPKSMPYNIAACDSSSYNYASGRLDHQTYFSSIDVERESCDACVMDRIFDLFWEEAVRVYNFNSPEGAIPGHAWDYPQHPVADVRAEAIANNFKLRNGSLTIPQVYADQGYDAEEQAQAAADYFGIPIEQYKQRQLDALFPPIPVPAPTAQASSDESDREEQAERQEQLEEAGTQ